MTDLKLYFGVYIVSFSVCIYTPHIPDSSQTLYSAWVLETSIPLTAQDLKKLFKMQLKLIKHSFNSQSYQLAVISPIEGMISAPSLLSIVLIALVNPELVFFLNLQHNSFLLPEKSNQTKGVLKIYQIFWLNLQHVAP